jgi:peptidoglycan DL-endopeptidase CwlO
MTATGRRWFAAVLAVFAALLLVTPASAAPSPNPPAEDESPLLGEVLAVTGKQYLQARTALEKSRKAQLRLALEVDRAQARVDQLTPQVGEVAAESYRTGRLTPTAALLNSVSPEAFLDRAVALEQWNEVNAERLRALTEARERAASAKAAMDAEVAAAAKAQSVMAKQKREAEKALALVGGFKLTGGFVNATSPIARPAPRGPDGQWKDESCSIDDPTTGGCITPRTLHAYKEVKRAGFDRFVGCFRSGGPYEHPKGRACDWSLRESGFSPAATKDQKMYGNNLAAFLIRNADRLGILYVIWYRQIWFPATGWNSYSGDSDHTDHVHMSML